MSTKEETLNSINDKLDTITKLLGGLLDSKIVERNTSAKEQDISRSNSLDYVKDSLYNYDLPVEEEFIEDLKALISKLNLKENDVNKVLHNVSRANEKSKIKDIPKFTFKCLYNYAEKKD